MVLFAALHARESRAQDVADTLFDCLIEPSVIVRLGTPVEGIVSQVQVERGDTVRSGQVIATLEATVEAALHALAQARGGDDSAIRSAEARHKFLKSKVERLKELLRKKIASRADVEEAEAEAEVALQLVNEATVNHRIAQLDEGRALAVLQLRTIKSPVDGIVTDVLIAPGEYRNGQSHLATIARTDPLNVEVFVPNEYLGRIKAGTEAEILPAKPVGGSHRARVAIVDRVLDARSGTFGVRLALPNSDGALPAGLSCQVRFLPDS